MVLVLGPDDVKGLITIKEAVEAMERGFLDWANNNWLAELRQRVHSPQGVRLTAHFGAPDSAGVMGSLLHTEKIAVNEDNQQTYPSRGARVRVIYEAETGGLISIQIGEIEVAGTPIHYLEWGDRGKPGIVFVHGGSAHAHWWTHLAPMFVERYHPVAIDMSGHGDSGRRSDYAFEVWAEEIMAVCAASGIDDKLPAVEC